MGGKGNHILVIEDMPSVGLLLKAGLQQAGHVVTLAATAREALTALEGVTGANRFDLIITDLNLPDSSGTALLSRLAACEACPPRIVLSADGSPETREAAFAAGASEMAEKPVDLRFVQDLVRKWCGDDRQADHPEADSLSRQHAQLQHGYMTYLASLVEDLEAPMPYAKLKSLVHQIKGSAALYGLAALSLSVRQLDAHLAEQGAVAAPMVQEQLRHSLRAADALA
jgi:DNA-binding response OmpR family regulator